MYDVTKTQEREWAKIEKMVEKYLNAELKTRQLVKKSLVICEDNEFDWVGCCDVTDIIVQLCHICYTLGRSVHFDIMNSEYKRNVYWGE